MPDDLKDLPLIRFPVPGRPLAGLTILVVEDSRLASDAIRLLCVRAGARIRRADTVRAARRHLQTYRPSVVICDLGLPDEPGLDFLADVAMSHYRPPALLGMSGDPDLAARSVEHGADGFLVKPVESLAAFQAAILAALSTGDAPLVGVEADQPLTPDPLALRDDLSQAAEALGHAPDVAAVDFVARFVRGVARVAHDGALERAASDLVAAGVAGGDTDGGIRTLTGLMRQRISASAAF